MKQFFFTLVAAHLSGELLAFKGTLARAEQNKNGDDIDSEGIKQIAETLKMTPVTLEHADRQVVGVWTEASVVNDSVEAQGVLYARRFPEIADGLVNGQYQLSVEASAHKAVCKACGKEVASPEDYCEHLIKGKESGYYPLGRILRDMRAFGGALVRKAAGTATLIDPMSIRMVASDVSRAEVPLPSVEEMIGMLVNGEYIPQDERAKMDEADFAGPHNSFPIRNQEDVYDAARLTGHADDPEAVKHAITRIAERKGLKLPDSWDTKKVEAKGGGTMKVKCSLCGQEFEAEELEAHVREELRPKTLELEASLKAKEDELTTLKTDLETKATELAAVRENEGLMRISARLVKAEQVFGSVPDAKKPVIARMDDEAFALFLETGEQAKVAAAKGKPALAIFAEASEKTNEKPAPTNLSREGWDNLFN